jgi:hypothetical protein
MEEILLKQQHLETHNMFNAKKYFGGLEISDLDKGANDSRLESIRLSYVFSKMFELRLLLFTSFALEMLMDIELNQNVDYSSESSRSNSSSRASSKNTNKDSSTSSGRSSVASGKECNSRDLSIGTQEIKWLLEYALNSNKFSKQSNSITNFYFSYIQIKTHRAMSVFRS